MVFGAVAISAAAVIGVVLGLRVASRLMGLPVLTVRLVCQCQVDDGGDDGEEDEAETLAPLAPTEKDRAVLS